jgi:hypothetical protein
MRSVRRLPNGIQVPSDAGYAVTSSQSGSVDISLRYSEPRVAAVLLMIAALLVLRQELSMGIPGTLSEPTARLILTGLLCWSLLNGHSWAWWASVLTGSVWLLHDFMRVTGTFALSGSLEPLYDWSELLIIVGFMVQAVAIGLLLRMNWGLRLSWTLSVLVLGMAVLVLGFWNMAARVGEGAGGSELGGSIYGAVVELVKTPEVKVSVGTVNGAKGVRVVIADSVLSAADSATQAPRSREVALHVRSLLAPGSQMEFVGIGWSLDTGPGVMPSQIHTFSVAELGGSTATSP